MDNIEDKTLRAVFKYKNHPSIIAIQNKIKNADTFYFTELNITGIEKKSRSQKQEKLVKILTFAPRLLRKILIYMLNFCVKLLP